VYVSETQEVACKVLIDAKLKPIKESQDLAVAFLGIRKFYAPAYMESLDKNILRLIARQFHEPARQQQLKLFKQLSMFKTTYGKNDLAIELEKHVRQQLRILSKMSQEDTDE